MLTWLLFSYFGKSLSLAFGFSQIKFFIRKMFLKSHALHSHPFDKLKGLWRPLQCACKHKCLNKSSYLFCETQTHMLVDMIMDDYNTKVFQRALPAFGHGQISWADPTVLMKPFLSSPPFSHSGPVLPWVTVARLRPRPLKTSCLGHCTPLAQLSPPNTFIQKGSDYFSSFIWATKHSQPPIWLFAEEGRTKLRGAEPKRLLEGGGNHGLLLAVWYQYGLL